ncbi:MAG: tetratricopeptide repeat protein [Flavobacteriaceae bacterium]|nr:tetratricopeptide repeat protein [Flavobacteriaceae bacterium]
MKNVFYLFFVLSLFSCQNKEITIPDSWNHPYQAITQSGDTLFSGLPNDKLIAQYLEKKKAFEAQPDSIDNLIWYGRFEAYLGNYRKAIAIYTYGLEKFPNDPHLLRHRGHRYITVREFDNAIADLSKAAELIKSMPNEVEPDGMPNAQNIPVSTLHGNIYYHLGLAYYLQRDLPKALDAFKACLSTSNSPDNVVSATHWIYMIQNRLGRKEAGDNYLRNIKPDMYVIENTTYYQACLFYKGEIPLEEIYPFPQEENASNTALKYALGNWFWYHGNPQKAQEIFSEIIKGNDWASFGYIAAETDLAKPYVSK